MLNLYNHQPSIWDTAHLEEGALKAKPRTSDRAPPSPWCPHATEGDPKSGTALEHPLPVIFEWYMLGVYRKII